jgi:hypothetical protein
MYPRPPITRTYWDRRALDVFGTKDGDSSISEAGVLYPEKIVDAGEEGDTSAEDEHERASK